jgi:hypothetical protein
MLRYTIGEIIDRLTITNLKMWHLEEQMNDQSISVEEKGEISEKIVKLNALRIRCIESIDEFFKEVK